MDDNLKRPSKREAPCTMKKRLICALLMLVILAASIPAAYAGSTLDNYATASFEGNFPVYSGPGDYYYRANNGKASYGGGTCRVFGVTGDWVMIGYQLSSGDYRIGYIKNGLSAMVNVKGAVNYDLHFDSYTALADNYCRLTDDPVINNKMIYTIPEGTPVTVLATMGTAWTYVEVASSSGYMRGFVWSIHLTDEFGQKIVTNPEATATPQPYVPSAPNTSGEVWPAVTPVRYLSNTFYHDTGKGEWLPVYGELSLEGIWPVYSGPGPSYYRANNGKATLGGGYCRIYGVENNWLLIGYGLSNGQYRIGYISIDALPQMNLRIPYLDLRYVTKQLRFDADLTDDTLRFRPTLVTLPAGSYVLFLGYAYDSDTAWAYVEVRAENSIMRGFIPASALAE